MGIYLNPGNEAYRMDCNSEIYIDKSGMIAEINKKINTAHRFIAISRPRRFGKTFAANMLAAYYDVSCDSSALFADKKISLDEHYKDYLNQYHVIKINMQSFLSSSSGVEDMLTDLESEILEELQELFPQDMPATIKGLPRTLEKLYAKNHEKYIFIIDEWDCILREKKNDTEGQKKYLDYLRNLLKDKVYVALAYMTGILPIKKYGTHSALNMFDEYSMMNPEQYAEYVGFTEDEVRAYCRKYDVSFEQMQDWYNGYYFEQCGHIYNPRAVVCALTSNSFQSYWTRTETYEALKIYIELNIDGLQDAIIQMIAGKSVTIDSGKFQNDMTNFQSRDDVLTLLVHLGYLAYDQKNEAVYIPNTEIRNEYKNAMEGAGWNEVVQAIKKSEQLLQATWNMDANAVAKNIETVHQSFASILKYNDENSLTCVLSIAYYNAMKYYNMFYELPTGKGYADIAFIPKRNVDKPALIIELKYDKSAQGAIEQIRNKHYADGLEEYQNNMLFVGINYDKDSKEHTCVIEKAKDN